MIVELWGTYPPPIGGVTIHIYRLVHHLRKHREIIVRNFQGTGEHKEAYVYKVKIPIMEFIKLPFQPCKIIHVHTSHIFALLLFLILGGKHKYVLTVHGKTFYNLQIPWKVKILTMFLRRADYILMNDKELGNKYAEKYQLPSQKIIIVPAYLKPLDSERKELPKKILQFRKKIPFLISANAFKLYKSEEGDVYGFDLLIRLISELKKGGLPVGLLFCIPQKGDHEYELECEKQIEDLGLSENILIYKKPIPNGFQVWEMSDLFIRPTLTDMEGLSVKEALAFGTPVIASDVCLRPSETFLFPKQDFEMLLKQSLHIINNYERATFKVLPEDDTISVVNNIYNKVEANRIQ